MCLIFMIPKARGFVPFLDNLHLSFFTDVHVHYAAEILYASTDHELQGPTRHRDMRVPY